MSSLLLVLALQSAAADPGIVVTNKLDPAYAECVAGGCAPLRDAQVSIAWAEQRFRQGAYLEAKRGLQAAVARNKGKAASDPKPVAALYEATATVAIHEGDRALYRESVGDRVRTLRDNLPAGDPAVNAAKLALGDMWVKLGDTLAADGAFRQTQREAEAQGDHATAISAAIRRAWLATNANDKSRADAILDEAAASTGAQEASVQRAIGVARLRLAARRGDNAVVERLVGEIAGGQGAEPALYQSAAYPQSASAVAADVNRRLGGLVEPVRVESSEVKGIKWADIGFWIRPDGRTEDIEVLRGSRAIAWANEMVGQIGSRRYAGVPADAAGQGVYRIERYTLRASYRTPIGSLIARRAGPERLEMAVLSSPGVRVIGTE